MCAGLDHISLLGVHLARSLEFLFANNNLLCGKIGKANFLPRLYCFKAEIFHSKSC